MADKSSIEWTDATWNPVTGCDRVSDGCDHCYALTLAKRLKSMGNPRYQVDGNEKSSGPGFGVTLHADLLDVPRRWKRPRLVFVNSMSDLFHPRVTVDFIASVFDAMASAAHHQYQVLTKRPERMARILRAIRPSPLPHVWLGTSIENNDYCYRADSLRSTPAAIRFLSLEPLLGPLPDLDMRGIDWIIIGGESGPSFRRMDKSWVLSLRDSAEAHGVRFFFKQWGGRTPKANGRELEGRTWDELPATQSGLTLGGLEKSYSAQRVGERALAPSRQ